MIAAHRILLARRCHSCLASDEADDIHGQTIVVDGGMTLYPGFAPGG